MFSLETILVLFDALITNHLVEDWGMEQVNEFFHKSCRYSAKYW